MNLILDRFKNNHCVYYAFLIAYCTGLRIAEVFALTQEDIDFYNKGGRIQLLTHNKISRIDLTEMAFVIALTKYVNEDKWR